MDKKLSRLTTEQRYELVAYLDGELDEQATARIEKLLAENAVARADVELLAATYELLDSLPRPKASSEFTEKTLATARLAEVKPDITQSPFYRGVQQSLPYFGWAAAMIVAGLLGFAATYRWVPQPHDELVRELELIQHLDKYQEVGSIEFLERLASQEPLRNELRGHPRAPATHER